MEQRRNRPNRDMRVTWPAELRRPGGGCSKSPQASRFTRGVYFGPAERFLRLPQQFTTPRPAPDRDPITAYGINKLRESKIARFCISTCTRIDYRQPARYNPFGPVPDLDQEQGVIARSSPARLRDEAIEIWGTARWVRPKTSIFVDDVLSLPPFAARTNRSSTPHFSTSAAGEGHSLPPGVSIDRRSAGKKTLNIQLEAWPALDVPIFGAGDRSRPGNPGMDAKTSFTTD